MHGYQITFFTQQDRKHGSQPLAQWLIAEAQRLGVAGATMFACLEGFGHSGKLHSAHFFDLADQPVAVMMVLTAEESERLFARLAEETIDLFYVRVAAEFGMCGDR